MTCSKDFGRLLQAGCLGLIGTLAVSAGCGGSETKPRPDSGIVKGDVGPVTPAILNVSTASVNLGPLDVGMPGTQSVTVTNIGGAASGPLTITTATAGITTTGCSGSLQAGASCSLAITALPTVPGAFSGSVSISATPGATTPLQVLVTATVIPFGIFTVEPRTVDLGTLAVGEIKKQNLTVTAQIAINDLKVDLNGADLQLDRTLTTCSTTLAAGAQCIYAINFAAATGGAKNENVTITAGGTNPKVFPVPFTALVQAPAKLVVVPSPAPAFTATAGSTSSPVPFAITNSGDVATGTLSIAITGAAKDSFAITANTCPAVLGPMGNCSVSVVYKPTNATTAETAALTLTDSGAPTTPTTVALTGNPLPASQLVITPATGEMGAVRVNTVGTATVFTVTNSGQTASGALTVNMSSPEFYVANDTCSGTSLVAGGTCTLTIELRPTSAGPKTAQLTVKGANTNAQTKMLTGTGTTTGTLVASPSSINFGSVFVNQKSAVTAVTLTNNGGTATGALALNLTGAGAAQVASVQNTCATLAPAATCVIGLQYSPTDTSGVSGALVVTDDAGVSLSIPMVGTGLAPTNLFVCMPGAGDMTCGTGKVLASTLDMGKVTLGYTLGNAEGTVSTDAGYTGLYTVTVMVPATATSDSGTLTPTLGGTNAADFKVTNNKCTTLNVGGMCTMDVTFTPGAVGARTASLVVSGSKGGTWTVQLTGAGLALVELVPAVTPTEDNTQLDFGQQPNGVPGKWIQYKMIVRGATATTATTTTANVVLNTASTTPDFRNYLPNVTDQPENNRCDGAVLALTAGTGKAPTTATAPANWARNTDGVWECTFFIQFYPQTGQSETAKTATVEGSATAGGTASLALTGTATGPLVFDPDKYTFRSLIAGQSSETGIITGNVTLVVDGNPDGGVGAQTAEFTLVNKGPNGVNQGPFTVVLDNTADFGIVTDNCSTVTAAAPLTTDNPATQTYEAGSTCVIKVIFAVAPTATAGTKTGTLTVTAASGEKAKATITGIVSDALQTIQVSPTGTAAAPVDLGAAAQDSGGQWVTFTITNPAATRSMKLDYSATDPFQMYTLATAGVTAYPEGFCGDRNTKQLAPGESCRIQVRLFADNTAAVGPTPAGRVLTVSNGGAVVATIPLKGLVTSQLTASTPDIAFGSIAQGAQKTASTTLTNRGTHAVTLTIPSVNSTPALPIPVSIVPLTTTANPCTNGLSLQPAASCQLDYQYQAGAPGTGIWDLADPTKPFIVTITGGAAVALELNLTGKSVNPATLALYGFAQYTAGNAIDLGNQLTGSTGDVLPIWFVNTGDVEAVGVTAAMSGTNASEIKITESTTLPRCGGTLAAHAKCAVPVVLNPTTSGLSKSATLTLSATGLSSIAVNLGGAGHGQTDTSPGVYVQIADGSAFATTGPTAVNATSRVVFSLRNNGGPITLGTDITVTGATGATDFSAPTVDSTLTNPCSSAASGIATGANCQFYVTFQPTAFGDNTTDAERYRWARINFGGNVIGGVFGAVQKPAKLKLTTEGAAGVVVSMSGAASTADFGQVLQQRSATLTFTISNVGEAATAGAVAPTLSQTGSYASIPAATNACAGVTLGAGGAANDHCTFVVSVGGSVLGVNQGINLRATGTVGTEESSEVVALIERLVQAPMVGIALTSGSTDLGTVYAGTEGNSAIITVTNGAAGDTRDNRKDTGLLTVTMTGATRDSFVIDTAASSCYSTTTGALLSLPLASGSESCTVVVTFKPTSAGAKAVDITVGAPADQGGTPSAISLTGKGLGALEMSPGQTSAQTSSATARVSVSATQTYLIRNFGAQKTGMLRASVTEGADRFVVIYDACFGQQLDPGQVCTIDVLFTGTVSATTAVNATVRVSDGTENNTVTSYVKVGGP